MSIPVTQTVYLKDYRPPAFLIDHVDLNFLLEEDATTVTAKLEMFRNPGSGNADPLRLNGQDLELISLVLNGTKLAASDYQATENSLTILKPPATFTLEITTRILPKQNTSLMGLFKSNDIFLTQCEAEGFRKITFFLDRPDVMAKYTTTIMADKNEYPVLLSNGNPVESGTLDGDHHWVRWVDPFPKPSYLFALVAGNLAKIESGFQTCVGREVALQIYAEPDNLDQCHHAMESLKKAIRWDEEVFGRELDLDVYMIVAVSDFNMGAMENKGLNIFNTKYVLARPETATDDDFDAIEAVIAHEYFHNWTGNRVTCRDWFQLSLKEGLTVFREQEFSADMTSRSIKRIDDVRALRTTQFSEDSGPMAHSVRPDSYMEISNFYTATVYEKGAEVIRMMQTLLGRAGFRKGMDLYFSRHDGQAVTTDDFVKAMEDANGFDLSQFRRWYLQAGTPLLDIRGAYDTTARTFTLAVTQSCPPTPGQKEKKAFHIPLAVGLIDSGGTDLMLQLDSETAAGGSTRVLSVTQPKQSFCFVNIPETPIPSLLRNFSAPVRVNYQYSDSDLTFLMAHDSDPFNRWEAGQRLALRLMLALILCYQNREPLELGDDFLSAFSKVLNDTRHDSALIALALTLPSENYIGEQMQVIDPDAVHAVRQFVRRTVATRLRAEFIGRYHDQFTPGPYTSDASDSGKRALKNQCLAYLMELEDQEIRALCLRQFNNADNMTDTLAALACFSHQQCQERNQVFDAFYGKWLHDPLVVNKWLTLQALSHLPDTLDTVKSLTHHPAFEIKNPNKVYALISAFCYHNPVRFHALDGSGYAFLAEQVLAVDSLNPQVAARIVRALERWRKYDDKRQALMRQQLETVQRKPGLSKDVLEIVAKSLS